MAARAAVFNTRRTSGGPYDTNAAEAELQEN